MTALSLITRALRAIGALAQGETPTAAEAQDGLLVLQEMVEGWATSRRTMQAVERVTFDLTSGEASYTLGEWVTTATSPQPTVSVRGTPGTTSYSYRVVATMTTGEVLAAGATGSTTTGHASMDGTNFNRLTWTALAGAATYAVYRTVGGATQGLIAEGLTAATLDDQALAGDSTSAPTTVTPPATHWEHAPISLRPDGVSTLDTSGLEEPLFASDQVERYQQIALKDTTGDPSEVYVSPGHPYTTFTFWPTPDDSTLDVVLYLPVETTVFADLSTDYSFARGYAEALRYNLAVRLAPEFGRPLDPQLMQLASDSMAAIKRANAREDEMSLPAALVGGAPFDILTGD